MSGQKATPEPQRRDPRRAEEEERRRRLLKDARRPMAVNLAEGLR